MSQEIITYQPKDHQLIFFANDFLMEIAKTKSVATYKAYASKISVFSTWLQANPLPNGFKSLSVEVRQHLSSFRAYIDSRYPSSRSKNLVLSVVRNFFKYLFRSGMLPENYASNLENFKVNDGHSKSALDNYQLEKVFEYLRNASGKYAQRNRALVILAISNGLRANEIANIMIEDISWRDGDRVIYLLRKGYTDKSCYTILNPNTSMIIDDIIGDRKKGYLFTSQRGEGLTPGSISKLTKGIFRACGIDDKSITLHSLRHTFARLALEANVNITQIMTAMNHKHLSSTQVYARAYDRHRKSAEKAINLAF